jgi:hypothetical protein
MLLTNNFKELAFTNSFLSKYLTFTKRAIKVQFRVLAILPFNWAMANLMQQINL